jgi:hypothetical protein
MAEKTNMGFENEVVPGLSTANVKDIADQIFSRKDGNHPQYSGDEKNGFLDILENAEPDISASPIFIRKVSS